MAGEVFWDNCTVLWGPPGRNLARANLGSDRTQYNQRLFKLKKKGQSFVRPASTRPDLLKTALIDFPGSPPEPRILAMMLSDFNLEIEF